jgi:CheY-like chemotaxis protein
MKKTPEAHGLRIFVVENHVDTLDSLRLYLEDLGHVVTFARNMTDALEKLPDSHCQMLISDIGLPDGTGWQLLQKARLSPEIFTVAMSGFGLNADGARSRAAGFRHHLLKPFKTSELDRVLQEAEKESELADAK